MDRVPGSNYRDGNFPEPNLNTVKQYFASKSCRNCSQAFAPDGIKLLRSQPGFLVVHVTCLTCSTPLGVAMVGVGTGGASDTNAPNGYPSGAGLGSLEDPNATCCGNASGHHWRSENLLGNHWCNSTASQKLPADWTKKDSKKFADKPAISYDDVLSAHQFFSNLGSDWGKYLPKPKRGNTLKPC